MAYAWISSQIDCECFVRIMTTNGQSRGGFAEEEAGIGPAKTA